MRLRSLLLLLTFAATTQAQQITGSTRPDQATLHAWLHGSDPRLIAWAATIARVSNNTALITEMPVILEHWTIPFNAYSALDEAQNNQRLAAMAVLDTLVESKADVPVATIKALARTFPTQTLLFISRMPFPQSRQTLQEWTYGRSSGVSGTVVERVAAMLLAKEPDRFIVENVLAEAEEILHITVTRNPSQVGGSAVGCGDSFGRPVTAGWPTVYTYSVLENEAASKTIPLVDLAGDHIDAERRKENDGWGSCGEGVLPLNAVTRHRILAFWLGIPVHDMPWQAAEYLTIAWTDQESYERELGALIADQNRKLLATARALQDFGTDDKIWNVVAQVRSMRGEPDTPQLHLILTCSMTPCPIATTP